MGDIFVDVILLFGAGSALGVSAYYMARSAAEVTDVKDWEKDKELREAHKWMTWAAVVGWVSVGLVILLIILYIILIYTIGESDAGWIIKGFLLIILAAMAIAGSLSALGASKMRSSSKFNDVDRTGAYRNAIIASVSALVGFVLIGGLFLWKLFYRPTNFREETKKEEVELEKQLVATKVAKLKAQEESYKDDTI